ncbi:MAG: hypothetical protein Q9190_002789 [Brigantiaea leucoxantha]
MEFIENSLSKQSLRFAGSRWKWKDFRASGLDHRPFFSHYATVRALKQSAESGCILCNEILNSPNCGGSAPIILAGEDSPAGPSVEDHFGQRDNHFAAFIIRALNSSGTEGKDQRYMFVLAKDEEECFQLPTEMDEDPLNYPSLHSGSEQCFDQLQDWYSACVESHERCIRERLALPKRLLDIGSQDAPLEKVVLCYGNDLRKEHEDIRYLALSYCWGGMSAYRTLRENLVDRMDGMALQDLPIVIRDAATVTRKCGIRYLWVDALCICQDDEQEWESESAAMADVYGGSVFTISALSSPNANTGFIGERNLRALPIGTVTLSYGTWKDSLTLFIRKQPRTLRQEFWHGKLHSRAWPLQERILAPAVLHYGRDQLLWECNNDHLCSETGATEYYGDIVIRLSDMLGVSSASGSIDLWDLIVQDFTRRKLSVPSDRLRALSGLASKLRKDGTRNGRYVAGLWESDLEFQLLWSSAEFPDTRYGKTAKQNFHVSTWSWAHRDVSVNCFPRAGLTSNLSRAPKFRFQDVAQDTASQQPGAVVSSCGVVLHGFVQKVGDTAIRVESQARMHPVSFTEVYPGLPGEDSHWNFDHLILGQVSHYCVRVADNARQAIIVYLLLEENNVDSPLETPYSHVYKRVGMLVLISIREENFYQPYPDIFFDNGKPLLTHGEWQDVILV